MGSQSGVRLRPFLNTDANRCPAFVPDRLATCLCARRTRASYNDTELTDAPRRVGRPLLRDVSQGCMSQGCVTQGSVSGECLGGVSPGCLSGVCVWGVSQGAGVCLGGMSQGCVSMLCLRGVTQGLCLRGVSQGCVSGMFLGGVSQKRLHRGANVGRCQPLQNLDFHLHILREVCGHTLVKDRLHILEKLGTRRQRCAV